MVDFGLLAAEVGPVVWGTLQISTGFACWQRYCTALYSSGRQPNFATLNRGRYLYSAGRPSRWALAHILVLVILPFQLQLQLTEGTLLTQRVSLWLVDLQKWWYAPSFAVLLILNLNVDWQWSRCMYSLFINFVKVYKVLTICRHFRYQRTIVTKVEWLENN